MLLVFVFVVVAATGPRKQHKKQTKKIKNKTLFLQGLGSFGGRGLAKEKPPPQRNNNNSSKIYIDIDIDTDICRTAGCGTTFFQKTGRLGVHLRAGFGAHTCFTL